VAEAIGDRGRRAVGEHVEEAEEDVDEESWFVEQEHNCLLGRKGLDNPPDAREGMAAQRPRDSRARSVPPLAVCRDRWDAPA